MPRFTLLLAVCVLCACTKNNEPALAHTYYVTQSPVETLITEYCIDCHNPTDDEGDLDLESILKEPMNNHVRIWQDVEWMLSEREMPPPDEEGLAMPSGDELDTSINWLSARLSGTAEPEIMSAEQPHSALIGTYCLSCHNTKDKKANLILEGIYQDNIEGHPEVWERVLRKLDARQMPPPSRKRPSETTYTQVIKHIESKLDALAQAKPNVGRVDTFRRLNRTEYKHSVRDLLALNIAVDTLLPADEASHGFDNITVSNLSPTLLNRYIDAAQKISHLAVGTTKGQPEGHTIRVRPDLTQSKHIDGMPMGTRGGVVIPVNLAQSGEYDIQIHLARDRNENVEGLWETHQMDILVDNKPVKSITIEPPKDMKNYAFDDSKMATRIHMSAGAKKIAVTFVNNNNSLLETKRQPYNAQFNYHRHPRQSPAVFQVSINGPYGSNANGSSKKRPILTQTPSRTEIFSCYPAQVNEETACAQRIIKHLTQKAFRRAVSKEDLSTPMRFYHEGRKIEGFDKGIEMALNAILVSPNFLFRIERAPEDGDLQQPYPISQTELASRISYFLWSSLPDEALLQDAIEGKLLNPDVVKQHVLRMLADPRAKSMITNFASQWLYLRNLASFAPDFRLFPDYDDNLRSAFISETQMFVESVLRSNKSVTDLLKANYTYLNERLAKHYDIPHIYGSRFRRVTLDKKSHRGGLLRHGSILTLTSYATRTSPVVRGHWVLENFLGTPPPPPPADVPSLDTDTHVSEALSVRKRLAKHRADPSCASCHNLMDPIGFAFENYDAVGRWRTMEKGQVVDASAGYPNGERFTGIEGLENAIIGQPKLFVRTLSEKLMTFALGRGLSYYDAPEIRKVVRFASDNNYRFSSLVLAIVNSRPFIQRMPAPSENNQHAVTH